MAIDRMVQSSNFSRGKRFALFHSHPDWLWGLSTQPHIQWVLELFSWCEVSRVWVDHSTVSSSKGKNEWSCTSTAPLCLHVMNRDKFIFLLFFVILLWALYTCFDTLFSLILLWEDLLQPYYYCYFRIDGD